MLVVFKLILTALIPVIAACLLYIPKVRLFFESLKPFVKQLVIGIIFGLISITGTEFGVKVSAAGNALINVRDSAPIIAGLVFGAPAGIIAGIIGGVERWFAVYWGAGEYTRLACSVATVFAGLFAAFLRKHLFENHRPGWFHGILVGGCTEIFHMLILFFTHMNNISESFIVVKNCAPLMILLNACSVTAALFGVQLISKKGKFERKKIKNISQIFQKKLLICVTVAFFFTNAFIIIFENGLNFADSEKMMQVTLEDVISDIETNGGELSNEYQPQHIGKSGYVLILDSELNILRGKPGYPEGKIFDICSDSLKNVKKKNRFYKANLYGEETFCTYETSEKYILIAVMPRDEVLNNRDVSVMITAFMDILIFTILFIIVYLVIKKNIVSNVYKVNASLSEITSGNLDEIVEVRSSKEFSDLSDDINATVYVLKKYIKEAEEKNKQDLETAKVIQESCLTKNFFEPIKSFDVYARMDTAKEVGGDFYDLYFVKQNQLNFLIADVSGKGIPAALFMMRAKTLLKTLAENQYEVNDVFNLGNNALCESNEAQMFVTAWMGSINLETGLVSFSNAGHNPPLVKHKNGEFEYLKQRAGFVLAGMEDFTYRKLEVTLEEGDIIFLYTDGVTEATDIKHELYGEERLKNILNSASYGNMQELCDCVKKDVDSFAGEAPQADDITMLAFQYKK